MRLGLHAARGAAAGLVAQVGPPRPRRESRSLPLSRSLSLSLPPSPPFSLSPTLPPSLMPPLSAASSRRRQGRLICTHTHTHTHVLSHSLSVPVPRSLTLPHARAYLPPPPPSPSPHPYPHTNQDRGHARGQITHASHACVLARSYLYGLNVGRVGPGLGPRAQAPLCTLGAHGAHQHGC